MDVYMWRYHKNKYVLFLLWGCILLLSCAKKRVRACDSCLNQALMDVGENEPKKEESKKCDTVSVFFYYEADEVSAVEKDHGEDEIIKLERTGDKLRGSFWVTSDEFVSGREGYLPGFTVLGMQNLVLAGDSISFLLDSHLHKFFSAPLCLDISSDKEAGRQGCHEWIQESEFFADSIQYRGVIRGDTLYLDETKNKWSRKFVRMNEDSIRRIDRSMPAEMEGQNRKNKVNNACNPVNK